ncbi:uncharacterized protein LOC116213469 isoform X2 [Punica granatum]|uniref:Uncharacterized protein LOC116213469 isoform X2 n=1 Tax=Punica granatum TaxID=22663 RepID=A0A6P8ECL5_PUNGR|nr:uncharacterized protein LOC116213469 isoform X2 [Punica granatum]
MQITRLSLFWFVVLWTYSATGMLVLGQDPNYPGFISIDCGASNASTDPVLQLYYQTDHGFIDSGENRLVTGNFTDGEVVRPTAETLRAFPNGTRNCYTIRPTTKTDEDSRKYLIRASFLYGNYDNQNRTPTFDLHIGVTFWVTVRLPTPYTHVHKEVIHVVQPTSDAIQVCLVNTGKGTPLISSLELRQLSNAIYLTDVHFQTLALHKRLNIGSTKYFLFRHPFDDYDRIWSPDDTNYGSDIQFLSRNGLSDPSLNKTNDPYKVPTGVLDTWAAGLESTFKFEENWTTNMAAPSKWIVYFHFAELMNMTSQRKFTIYSNNKVVETIDLNYLEPVTVRTHQFTSDIGFQFQFVTSGSTSPPILNALELYRLLDLSTAPTNIDDVTAMSVIKKAYNVRKESWQGDPCVPTNFTWDGVNCSTESPPRITSLNLCSSGLKGKIADSLANLTALVSLNLSHNQLSGSVPGFLAELTNLKHLDLSGNDLSGSVPKNLRTKADAGTLDLHLDGNPNLCKSGSCGLSKKTKYIIIGTVLLVALGSASAVWSWTTHWNKDKAQITQDVESNKKTSKPEGQGISKESNELGREPTPGDKYEENNKRKEDRSSLKEGDEQYEKLRQEVSSLKKMLTKQVTMWSQVPQFIGQIRTIMGGMSGQPADAVFPKQHDSEHCRLDHRQQRDGDDEKERDSGQNDAHISNELSREPTLVKVYEKSQKKKQDGSEVNPHTVETTEAYRQSRSQEDNNLATQEWQVKAIGRKKKGLIQWMNWLRRHGFISALAGSSEMAQLSEEQYKPHTAEQDGSGVNPHTVETTSQVKAIGRKKKGLIHWMNWLRRHGFISALAGSSETAQLSKEQYMPHAKKQDGSGVNPHTAETTEAYRQSRSQEDNNLATQESQVKATGRKKKGLIHWMNWLRRLGFISALAGSSETAQLSEEQYMPHTAEQDGSGVNPHTTETTEAYRQSRSQEDNNLATQESQVKATGRKKKGLIHWMNWLRRHGFISALAGSSETAQLSEEQYKQLSLDSLHKTLTEYVTMWSQVQQFMAQMTTTIEAMSDRSANTVFPQQHHSQQRHSDRREQKGGDDEDEENHGQDDSQMAVSMTTISGQPTAVVFLQQHHSRQHRPIQYQPRGGDNEAKEYHGQDDAHMSKEIGSELTLVEVYGKNYEKNEDQSWVNPHATEITETHHQAMSKEDNSRTTEELGFWRWAKALGRNKRRIIHWMNCLYRLGSISGLSDPSGMAKLSNKHYEQLTQGVTSLKEMLTKHGTMWSKVPQLMDQMTTSMVAISDQHPDATIPQQQHYRKHPDQRQWRGGDDEDEENHGHGDAQVDASMETISDQPLNAVIPQHRSRQHRPDQHQWRGGDDEGEENHGHDNAQMDAIMVAMPGPPADVVSLHPRHSQQRRLNQRRKRGGDYEDTKDHGQDDAQMSRELEEEPTVDEVRDINDKRKDDAEIIETDQQTRSQEDNSPATQQPKAQMWANLVGRNKKGRLQWMNWLCRLSSINELAGPSETTQMSDEQFDQLNQEVSSFEKMLTEQVNKWSQFPQFMDEMTESMAATSSRPTDGVFLQQHRTRQRRPDQRPQKDINDAGEEDHEQDDAQTATSMAAMFSGPPDVVFLQQHHSQQRHSNQRRQRGGDDEDEEDQGLDNAEMAASIGAMSGQPADVVFLHQHRSQQRHLNQRHQRGGDDEVEEDRGLDDAQIATSMVAMLGQPTDSVFPQQHHSQQRHPNQRQEGGEVAEDKEDRGQGAEMAASIVDMFDRPADVVFSHLHPSQQRCSNQPFQRGGNVRDAKNHGLDAAQTATSMAVMSSQLADVVFPQQHHPNQRQQRGGDEEEEEGHGQDDTQMAASITAMLGRPTDVDFLQQHHSKQRHPNQCQKRDEVAEDKEDRSQDDADRAASIADMFGRPTDVVFSQLHQSQQHRPNQRQQRFGNVGDAKNHGQNDSQTVASMVTMSGQLADAVFPQQHHSQQCHPNQRQQRGGDDEEEEYHGQDHAQMAVSMAAMFGQPIDVAFLQQYHSQQHHPNQSQQRGGDEHEEDRGQDDAQMAASTKAMLGQAADVAFPQQHHSQQRHPNQRQQRGGDDEFEEDRGLDDAQIAASMVALGQPIDAVFSQLHNSQQCRPNQRR